MARVLVTGMSGTGKSSLLAELARRGHRVVDTDDGGWKRPDGVWDEDRMTELLASHADLVVSGTVDNQPSFYDRFAHVVLLSAPVDVLLRRVAERTTNPYGRSSEDQAEIRRYVEEVEPLLRAGATVELDARRPLPELAGALRQPVAPAPRALSASCSRATPIPHGNRLGGMSSARRQRTSRVSESTSSAVAAEAVHHTQGDDAVMDLGHLAAEGRAVALSWTRSVLALAALTRSSAPPGARSDSRVRTPVRPGKMVAPIHSHQRSDRRRR